MAPTVETGERPDQMISVRSLLGLVGLASMVGGYGLAAGLLRRRLCPPVSAPLGWLIEGVLAVAGIVAAGLLLGTFGWLRAEALVATGLALAAGSLWTTRRKRSAVGPNPSGEATPGLPPWVPVALGAAAATVAVRWLSELLLTVSRGFSHTDELHYHLTHAAGFAQSGRTWPILFPSVGDAAAYHPSSSELLHAVGMSVLGSDFASILVNVLFAAMAVGAAWVIGARAGNAPAGALLAGAVLCLPPSTSEAGSALNDTVAFGLLLAAAALLIEAACAGGDARLTAIGGVAAGVAAGTKLTVLVPVLGLTILVLTWPARARVRGVIAYLLPVALLGSYWYVRNLVATGNPVPALSLGPLPALELPFQRSVEHSVASYLFDVAVWRDHFLPGLERVFGDVWPLLPGLAGLSGLAALTRAVRGSDPKWSALSLAGSAGLAAYAVTPTSAGGDDGAPVLFALNLRYAFPGLLLCGLAGLAHPAARRHPAPVAGLGAVVFLVSNLRTDDLRRAALATILVAMAALVLWVAARVPQARRTAAAGVLGLLLVAAPVVEHRYLEDRWRDDLPRWDAYEAMREVQGARIGVTGYPQMYPFYGPDLSNEVVMLGDRSRPDELLPFRSCAAFWSAITSARLDLVVVLSAPGFAESDFGQQVVVAPARWLHGASPRVVVESEHAEVVDVRDATPACA